MAAGKLLGITVLPEYIQSEGIEGLLDNLSRIGANAVATSPYLMEEADRESGQREPPADADAGSVRLLDRPLFGKREVWVRTAPSFEPDESLYAGLRYQPSKPTDLTRREGHLLRDFIPAAKERGIRVYLSRSRQRFRRATGYSSEALWSRTGHACPTVQSRSGGWQRTAAIASLADPRLLNTL